jgi:hypothetical protein
MGHMYFVDPSNKKMMIEFVRDEKTNKFYLWDIERARLLTLNQLNELMDYINQYIDTVDVNEIKETNDRLELKDLEERYKIYFVMNSYYTSHCLAKEYSGEHHGHVVVYEDHKGFIRFDSTRKTKNRTLSDLLNHLRDKIKKIHIVYEATEAKKLCAWLYRIFPPGFQRSVVLESDIKPGEDPFECKPYDPAYKALLLQSLREQHYFPQGINDIIVSVGN